MHYQFCTSFRGSPVLQSWGALTLLLSDLNLPWLHSSYCIAEACSGCLCSAGKLLLSCGSG